MCLPSTTSVVADSSVEDWPGESVKDAKGMHGKVKAREDVTVEGGAEDSSTRENGQRFQVRG